MRLIRFRRGGGSLEGFVTDEIVRYLVDTQSWEMLPGLLALLEAADEREREATMLTERWEDARIDRLRVELARLEQEVIARNLGRWWTAVMLAWWQGP